MGDVTRLARNLINHSRIATERYGTVLSIPGARGFFFSAAVARLGVAMTGLGLLWTIRGITGSFAVAGTATAVFAFAEAIVGPQMARLIDRYGQSRILPLLLIVHVVGILAVVLGSLGPIVVVILSGAVIAGAAVPQPGALSSARWTHLLPTSDRLRTAFSLEAVVNDIVFLSGPPIVTLASGFTHPYLGTILAASLMVTGGLALALQKRTAPARQDRAPHASRYGRPSFLGRGFVSTLGVTLGLGFFFGASSVIVTAFATERGFGPATGFILALTSAASLASGLAYGATKERWRPHTVQIVASALLFAAIAVSALWLSLPALLVGFFLAGATIAPINVSSTQIVERSVPRASLTQGFTWINSASAAGIALAAAVSGLVVQNGSVHLAVVACCGLVLVAPISALFGAFPKMAKAT